MKLALVTSCGNKKQNNAMPAWRLYKSTRIKAVYNLKMNYDMFILSAEHGLIPTEKIIDPYNRKISEARITELIPRIKQVVNEYDAIVYFKGGSNRLYFDCIKKACADITLVCFGSKIMEGIHNLQEILKFCSEEKFSELSQMKNVYVFTPRLNQNKTHNQI